MLKNKRFVYISLVLILLCSFAFINEKSTVYSSNIADVKLVNNENSQNTENSQNADNSLDYLKEKCKAFYLVEYNTGKIIASYNENDKLQIASMVKIMTASIVFDKVREGSISLDDEVEISDKASKIDGSKILLDAGSKHKVKDLLKTVVVCSANDSAIALSEKIAGNEDNFVKIMNEKATKLGLSNTKFINATGLPLENQYSSAKDVSIMLKDLMKNKLYFDYCKIWLEDYVHPSGRKTSMTNTNKLIRYYKGCDVGKTGYTSVAKHCLAASACRNNTRYIAVVIGGNTSKERFFTVSELFNYGFENYSNRLIYNKGQKVGEINIKGASKKIIPVYAKNDVTIFSKNNEKVKYTTEIVNLGIKAPIQKGGIVAKLKVKANSIENEFDLVVNEQIQKQNYIDAVNDIFACW